MSFCGQHEEHRTNPEGRRIGLAGDHWEPCPPNLSDDELRSRLYGWLSDRTSRPDGSEWEHGSLRVAVDDLLRIIR